jgi:site-specific recombinase
MWGRRNKHIEKTYAELFGELELAIQHNPNYAELDFLVGLVEKIRPEKTPCTITPSLEPLLHFLRENPKVRENCTRYVQRLLTKRRFKHLLSNTGIIQDSRFFGEVIDRIVAKFLPEQPEKNTLEYLLNQVLFNDDDYLWVQQISFTEYTELMSLLSMDGIYDSNTACAPIQEVIDAISLLMQRTSGRFLEKEVLQMLPEFEHAESPFVAFEKQFDVLVTKLKNQEHKYLQEEDPEFCKLQAIYTACHATVKQAFSNSKTFGISIRVNQNLLRVQQQLDRIGVLLPLLIVSNSKERVTNSIVLAQTLIQYNCKKNNIVKLIADSTQTLAYEITQHTAKTGEHYITQSRKQYLHMLYTAMGGGLIVGFLCIFKVLASKADVSDFGQAVIYSLNYAIGFIIIYLLGFTLATKQPAMTAAAIVQTIEIGYAKSINEKDRHIAFAKLFAQLFRSQFIAFVGNVIVAFPVALFLVYATQSLFGYNLVAEKANTLLNDLSPIHSKAIFHAAIAGFFLFLSGIISGAISNRNKHKRVYYRISEHPLLKKTMGKVRTKKLARIVEQKWPGIASNFWFGVFMGSTVIVGVFFGLNLDIRHITFAAGNFALGLFGNEFNVSGSTLFWSIAGIGIIGFVNFIVSFLLSLSIALRSRNINILEVKFLFKSVWRYFKKKPLSFFIPV